MGGGDVRANDDVVATRVTMVKILSMLKEGGGEGNTPPPFDASAIMSSSPCSPCFRASRMDEQFSPIHPHPTRVLKGQHGRVHLFAIS